MRTKEQFEKEMVDFRVAIRGHWGTGFFKAVVEYMKSKGYEQPVIIKLSEIPNYLHVHFFTDILGGKIMFVKTILLEPISAESEGATVKLRRKLTAFFTNRIKARKNPYIKGDN